VLSLLILVPLAGLLLLNLLFRGRPRKWAFAFTLILPVLQAALVCYGAADKAHLEGFAAPSWLGTFFSLPLACDALTLVLLMTIAVVVLVTVLVGGQMIQGERQQFGFLNVLLLAMTGMNGVVLMTDLFSLYVFLEVTSVATFVLIAFHRDRHALEGAFKYLVLSAVATALMLGSVALLMMMAGGTSFQAVKAVLAGGSGGSLLATIAVGAFVIGLFIKGGLVPFHGWLPGAYSAASAPVSILLAGVVTKVSGIYALVRLAIDVFPITPAMSQVLLLVGAVSIIVGAVAAIGQSDLKRMLSYSSISQMGYIVLGVACGSPLGVVGAVFHLFNHAIFKSLLFVNSAALEQRVGTTDMNRMGGLGSRMPVTSASSALAMLSTAGVPPLAGFWSKLIIILALWQTGAHAYAIIAVLMSVVTLAYLLLIQRKVFFGKKLEAMEGVKEVSFGLLLPELILAALTIGVGLLAPFVLQNFILPVMTLAK
jgi:multicomponent Na+:H+ antiporter subunit D